MNKGKKKAKESPALQLALLYPQAAGLDVGSMNMVVSYQDSEGKQKVVEYTAYTEDLKKMGQLLINEGVEHLAMEATGSYWMSVYDILEDAGINITLVNARHYKNVTAQKTDVKDAQWLQQLHAHGLLRGSHIAPEKYRELRTYIHERVVFQNQKSDALNRIQKILTQMNIKVQHIISDIEGVAGMQIIQKIANGICTPDEILSDVNTRSLKASHQELVKSLEGQYKPYLIHVLKQHIKAHGFYKEQMKQYEERIEYLLDQLLPVDENGHKPLIKPKTKKSRKNQYSFNLRDYLTAIAGTDLTEIDGLDEATVLSIISITGTDMGKWKTSDHFTSWLNLSPRMKKSGGKLLGHQKRYTNNQATQAFRLGAQSVWNNKNQLGHLYRRLSASKGSKKAIKAVARRLAVIYYQMMKNKTPYEPQRVSIDNERYRILKLKRLQKEAEKLGYALTFAA